MKAALRFKILIAGISVLALAACSSSYEYYDETAHSDGSGYYDQTNGASGYGGQIASGYDMGGHGMSTNCFPNPYSGGYTQSGLRTGQMQSQGKKSRYGYWEYGGSIAGCMGGYWIVPTYQIIQQPAATTTTESTITTTVLESCPDGQYRMENGDCAIMITDEPEQYVPPVIEYPEVTVPPLEWYKPARK